MALRGRRKLFFVEIRGEKKIQAGLVKLRKVIPRTLETGGYKLAEYSKGKAEIITETLIPATRRNNNGPSLVESFQIDQVSRVNKSGGSTNTFYMYNTKSYANFIDKGDISKSSGGAHKLSAERIDNDARLSTWFLTKADWGREHPDRLPKGATIGAPGGKFHQYSIFNIYQSGIHFMDKALIATIERFDKDDTLTKIKGQVKI